MKMRMAHPSRGGTGDRPRGDIDDMEAITRRPLPQPALYQRTAAVSTEVPVRQPEQLLCIKARLDAVALRIEHHDELVASVQKIVIAGGEIRILNEGGCRMRPHVEHPFA